MESCKNLIMRVSILVDSNWPLFHDPWEPVWNGFLKDSINQVEPIFALFYVWNDLRVIWTRLQTSIVSHYESRQKALILIERPFPVK